MTSMVTSNKDVISIMEDISNQDPIPLLREVGLIAPGSNKQNNELEGGG